MWLGCCGRSGASWIGTARVPRCQSRQAAGGGNTPGQHSPHAPRTGAVHCDGLRRALHLEAQRRRAHPPWRRSGPSLRPPVYRRTMRHGRRTRARAPCSGQKINPTEAEPRWPTQGSHGRGVPWSGCVNQIHPTAPTIPMRGHRSRGAGRGVRGVGRGANREHACRLCSYLREDEGAHPRVCGFARRSGGRGSIHSCAPLTPCQQSFVRCATSEHAVAATRLSHAKLTAIARRLL